MATPKTLYVEWGFTSFEVPWDIVPDNIRKMLDEGMHFDGGAALDIIGDYCGKSLADILKESPKNLMPENRDKFNLIMNFLGLPDDCSIDDFAERYGGISRQEFIELIEKR